MIDDLKKEIKADEGCVNSVYLDHLNLKKRSFLKLELEVMNTKIMEDTLCVYGNLIFGLVKSIRFPLQLIVMLRLVFMNNFFRNI